MEIIKSKTNLVAAIQKYKKEGRTIGFVPTMGALHAGHLSLVEAASRQADCVMVSIFVNPTQFNNSADLERYPRPIAEDIALLQQTDCNVLFLPEVEEMYASGERWHLDLGPIESVLEGKFRAGHYQGVTQIVKKLFDLVLPDLVFLGQKDFQQVLVLQRMVDMLNLRAKLIMCPIVREEDGLALSSRNVHLNSSERTNALVLSKVLFWVKENFNLLTLSELKEKARLMLNEAPGIEAEYFEICDSETLMASEARENSGLVALVAARVGRTRLIDNIILV